MIKIITFTNYHNIDDVDNTDAITLAAYSIAKNQTQKQYNFFSKWKNN